MRASKNEAKNPALVPIRRISYQRIWLIIVLIMMKVRVQTLVVGVGGISTSFGEHANCMYHVCAWDEARSWVGYSISCVVENCLYSEITIQSFDATKKVWHVKFDDCDVYG